MISSFLLYMFVFLISCMACWRYELVEDKFVSRQNKKGSFLSYTISLFQLEKWICVLFVLVPPIFIYTFRSLEIGTDTYAYLQMYQYNKYLDLFRYFELYGTGYHSHELGFQLIMRLSYLLDGGYNLVKFFCGFLIVFFAWRGFIYYHKKFGISTGLSLFFFYLLEFSYGFNGTRFAIALSIFLYGFQFVIEKKFLKYIFCCLLMCLFHSSMVLAVLFYLINFSGYTFLKQYWKYVAMVLIIALVVFLRNFVDSVNPLVAQYFVRFEGYKIDTSANYGLGIIAIFILFLLPLVRWNKFVSKNVSWTCIFMVSLSFILFRLCGYYSPWLIRLSRMPEILFCVLYSGTACLAISVLEKYLWRIYTVTGVLVYYVISMMVEKSSEVYPYVLDFTNYL